MDRNMLIKVELIKTSKFIFILAASLLICTTVSGCIPVNRVSMAIRQPTGTPIDVGEVTFYPGFNDIHESWQLEGMISAFTLPACCDNQEKREALVKKTAAGLGINSVVGLMPNVGASVDRLAIANGLLVNVGAPRRESTEDDSKFIVCLPPVNFKIDKTPVMSNLDNYLREEIQYQFGYYKGYYVYRCDAPGVDNISILDGSISPAALAEPIGRAPDYALLCDLSDYKEVGSGIGSSIILNLAMTLYDLKENKIVWSRTTENISSYDIDPLTVGMIISPFSTAAMRAGAMAGNYAGAAGRKLDIIVPTRNTISKALKDLPTTKGFRGGPNYYRFVE